MQDASLMAQTVKNLPTNIGHLGLIPGLGRSPGGGYGYTLHYSCLENSVDREDPVRQQSRGLQESQTWLKQLSRHALFLYCQLCLFSIDEIMYLFLFYSLFAVYFSGNSFFKLLTIFLVVVISSSLSILSNYSFQCISALYHMCCVICIELNISVFHLIKNSPGTSLVVRWLGPMLPMQGVRVWSLIRKLDPTWCSEDPTQPDK